eukprot:CAMPEP_0173188554 /NCGR_PEP_ID=MMETSP1141-20130122/11315_1 /TAXON_ID=483371 /ORGANISM="non described non described, Strain CCMP2298" /LENGTH=111 /DNA_ID=CAMNT_0014112487 /DNA_START=34 /DNA_END=369 /DNA_ORIENTATION=+
MDTATFQRELQKFKVVRLEDYYHPRMKKTDQKMGSKQIASGERRAGAEKDKGKAAPAGPAGSFWVLLEAALADTLAPSETTAFLAEMRRGLEEVPRSINLEDLDLAAKGIA